MTYVAGVFLGIVVGFGLAAVLARRSPGFSPIGGRRVVFLAVAAVALVGGSIGLARRDHDAHPAAPVAAPTTSAVAPAPSSTTPTPTATATATATEPHPIVSVPDLVGKTRAAALAALRNLALIPNLQMLASPSVPPGYVLSQNPVTESLVTEGSTVSLVVSAAP